MNSFFSRGTGAWLFAAALALTCFVYWPGLSGSWFYDDFPNIVDNADVQPDRLGTSEIRKALLSSPASDLKRPLASLSFLANHAVNGMNPFGWKITNLAIHLLNGWLLFLLTLALFRTSAQRGWEVSRASTTAALLAAAWLLQPINLTAVLLVVQRMESLSNLFVLAGLLGYVSARQRMQAGQSGFARCAASLVLPTAVGLLVKETAAMLPLYAALVEWALFRLHDAQGKTDRRLLALFAIVLVLPAVAGLALLLPWLLNPATWITREFTLQTRLLSEARIVIDYVGWSLLPLPQSLSFYHDHFRISSGLLSPWTTLACILIIGALLAATVALRRRRPLVSLGIALYFAGHVLTATVLPLELIYEHRNYFASFGLLLALVPLLTHARAPVPAVRYTVLAVLLVWWSSMTWLTSIAWSSPLRLATELAIRAPESPRAQFGFGRELLQASGFVENSPRIDSAFAVLERAAAMPESSILAEQALIVNSYLLDRPQQPRWWQQLSAKLASRAPNTEDISALGTLTRCARDRHCDLPQDAMRAAFDAALTLAPDDARILTIYSDWAWSVNNDRPRGLQLAETVVRLKPRDTAARIVLARMNVVLGRPQKVREQLRELDRLNYAGSLDSAIQELRQLVGPDEP